MANTDPRNIAELYRLIGDREGAGNHRLRRNNGGAGRQDHHWDQSPIGSQEVERILNRFGMRQDQRSLTEIVQQERGKDKPDPGLLDRLDAKMSHIRIKRFTTRDGQHHSAQHGNADTRMIHEKMIAVKGIKGLQNLWVLQQ